jgi:Fe2+ transport system protein B
MDNNHFIDKNFIEEVLAGRSFLDHSDQIEDALVVISAAEKKIDFLKKLKQRRINPINDAIKTQEQRIEILKKSISECMSKNKDKTLDFPDFSKVTLKKIKGTWTIIDEENLAVHLKSLGKFDEVGEEIVQFNKSKLNKVLDELEKNNNISDYVKREESRDSISISFVENSSVMTESIDDILPSQEQKHSIPSNARIIPLRNIDVLDMKPDNLNDLSF